MYIFYFCILALLLQTSFSLNEEEIDLNLLSSNYDGVDTIGENIENIAPDESGIVVFDRISAPLLEKLCKNSNTLVYVTQEDITIDCEAFNKGDQPVEQSHDIIKRSVDPEEGSGMPDTEETTIPAKEATTILAEATTILAEEATTILAEEAQTIEEEATTILAEEAQTIQEEATTILAEDAKTILEEATTIPQEKLEDETITMLEKVTTTEESATRRKYALVIKDKAVDVKNEATTIIVQPTAPKEENEENPQVNLQEDKKEVVVITTPQPISLEENKEKPQINQEGNKDKINENTPTPEVEKKEKNNYEPNNDAEVVNKKSVTNLPPKEENQQANSDEPEIKPSTENTKKAGSKDTTILIVLFAAVVVVGALAFGYNYVKKRKQQSADLERVERGSIIKRSLQNLTKPEAGEPERKPLIGDPKEVEMVDMTKVTLVENSEKPSTEQVVKT